MHSEGKSDSCSCLSRGRSVDVHLIIERPLLCNMVPEGQKLFKNTILPLFICVMYFCEHTCNYGDNSDFKKVPFYIF